MYDPAPGPEIAAAGGDTARVGEGCREEMFRGGGASVDEQGHAGGVEQADAVDIDAVGRCGLVRHRGGGDWGEGVGGGVDCMNWILAVGSSR